MLGASIPLSEHKNAVRGGWRRDVVNMYILSFLPLVRLCLFFFFMLTPVSQAPECPRSLAIFWNVADNVTRTLVPRYFSLSSRRITCVNQRILASPWVLLPPNQVFLARKSLMLTPYITATYPFIYPYTPIGQKKNPLAKRWVILPRDRVPHSLHLQRHLYTSYSTSII